MPKLVIVHKVVDVDRWLSYKAERAAQIAQFGSNVVDHVAVDGSNNIAVTADVTDLAVMQAALASPPPELGAAMERHGVIPRSRSTSRSSPPAGTSRPTLRLLRFAQSSADRLD